jgi:DNA repair exonuclease SbcCD nuclease subunit
MPARVLCIGDPHVQVTNIPEVDLFMEHLINLAANKNPDFIVILGDLLHTHERLHILALNKAYELIDNMRVLAKTYVLVGNHDMCNNQQFLSDNHWLSGMKEWDNVVIVDRVLTETIKGEKFVFVPYVPVGRFQEALNTLETETFLDASCIFAHQEFAGCKMGAIVSVEGDKWPLDYPHIVSGHIHSRQIPQPNVYYTGSAMQHAFGESEKNIIAYLTFHDGTYDREEIDLQLPRKKIVYMDVEDVDTYATPETADQIKVTLSGNYDQFKALKKTKKYKELVDQGIKVVFKPKKIGKKGKNENKEEDNGTQLGENQGEDDTETNFGSILLDIVNQQKNPYLVQAYDLVVNSKETDPNEIIFV